MHAAYQQERPACRTPQRLHAEHPSRVMIQSALHGDMQRLAEMASPLVKARSNNQDEFIHR